MVLTTFLMKKMQISTGRPNQGAWFPRGGQMKESGIEAPRPRNQPNDELLMRKETRSQGGGCELARWLLLLVVLFQATAGSSATSSGLYPRNRTAAQATKATKT